jgi:hypothetical protein
MRNNFEIGSLNPEAAEIGEAKYTPRPRIGIHVPGKPTHHLLGVGQKSKNRRWRGVDSYFTANRRFQLNFNIRVFSDPRDEIGGLISSHPLSRFTLCSRHVESTMADNGSTCKISP